MGTDDGHMPDTRPWHRVYVDGFCMDRTEVTNEQFARFARETGYVTVAERKPRAGDFPADAARASPTPAPATSAFAPCSPAGKPDSSPFGGVSPQK